MPHLRQRYLRTLLDQSLRLSPIVGILGHRQVGKTTLMESMVTKYHTLDDARLHSEIAQNAQSFVENLQGLRHGIDECQKEPKLFPALKERVRKDKRPGQFLLSGSVRFTSKKSIQESLTGRIINFDLLPLTVSEILHQELPSTLRKILKIETFNNFSQHLSLPKSKIHLINEGIEKYLKAGGLPGALFIREKKMRDQKMFDQLQTILDRDVRTVYPTNVPYNQMLEFLTYISKHQGQPLNQSEIKRQVGLNHSTQKNLAFALEAVFLIRSMYSHAGSEKSTLVYYLEDQGESYILAPEQSPLELFEQLIYRNFRAEFFYSKEASFSIFKYQTRGGASIPFVVKTEDGALGVLPILEEAPNRAQMASIASFFRSYNNSKVVIVTKSKNIEQIDERVIVLPAYTVV